MIRNCTTIFLLLALLVSTFSKAIIVVEFYANQNNIAQNLCENKDKPMMHCCGRCQLRKRLAHEDDQNKNNPERKSENNDQVAFLKDFTAVLPAPLLSFRHLRYHSYTSAVPIDHSVAIFHPPA
jgi:hypothetical protein